MSRIRVLLADDHAVVRAGIRAVVAAEPDMEVVGEAADGPTALALVAALDPDVVVADISMPGMTGVELTTRLREANPARKVVVLTVHEDIGYLRAVLDAGAAGYVPKRAAADDLVRALRTVADGGAYVDPILGAAAAAPGAGSLATVDLSDRETEVVKFIARGFSNKEIAAKLSLSVKTVETYKARSLEKLGVRTRVGLVQYAAERGWLTPA
ncbi:MAG TPA: response regulator transcription factor [Urbifossiella sp.]|nr:response regulator transcription factor [Urbifossiella sp.]